MNLEQLRVLLASSNTEKWHLVELNPKIGRVAGGAMAARGHLFRATYRSDIGLTLAWGRDSRSGEVPGAADGSWPCLRFVWASGFEDRGCYPHVADVFWLGVLVDRIHYLVVDGAQGMVPWPLDAAGRKQAPARCDQPVVPGWTVGFVSLLDELVTGTTRTRLLMKRMGIRVADDRAVPLFIESEQPDNIIGFPYS